MDLQGISKDSRQTYSGFLTVTVIGVVLVALILILMAVFLV